MAKLTTTGSSFCSMLWKHICIRPNFMPVPCCRFKGQTTAQDFNFNNDDFKNIRKKMLAGQPVKGCEDCYDEEALTHDSLRLWANRQFGSDLPVSEMVTHDLVEYLELFVGAVCNLKCIICSPALSSSLYEEYKRNNWAIPLIAEPTADLKIDFIEKLIHLKHIKFVGGEPILNKLHDKVMESIRNLNMDQIRLTYQTNCTVWPNPATLATWRDVQHLNLNLSIDGVGDKNEYLRKNSKWDKVDHIVRQYFALADKHPHISLQITATVSILNMLYLKEIEEWFQNIAVEYPNAQTEPVYLTYLTDPPALSPHNAPPELIQKVIETYSGSGSPQQLKIINLLKTISYVDTSETEEGFLEYVGRFDRWRNTSFKEVFPELSPFF